MLAQTIGASEFAGQTAIQVGLTDKRFNFPFLIVKMLKDGVPKDPRMLLGTPQRKPVRNVLGRDCVHSELDDGIQSVLNDRITSSCKYMLMVLHRLHGHGLSFVKQYGHTHKSS